MWKILRGGLQLFQGLSLFQSLEYVDISTKGEGLLGKISFRRPCSTELQYRMQQGSAYFCFLSLKVEFEQRYRTRGLNQFLNHI